MWFIYVCAVVIWGLIWGFATRAIIYNKGYSDNWFWWGFFFGFIALIVALSKSDNHHSAKSYGSSMIRNTTRDEQIIAAGGWKCSCGRTNYHYVSTCVCGRSKNDDVTAPTKTLPSSQTSHSILNESNIEAVRNYKKLLDEGVITQEELEKKKKQLLEL